MIPFTHFLFHWFCIGGSRTPASVCVAGRDSNRLRDRVLQQHWKICDHAHIKLKCCSKVNNISFLIPNMDLPSVALVCVLFWGSKWECNSLLDAKRFKGYTFFITEKKPEGWSADEIKKLLPPPEIAEQYNEMCRLFVGFNKIAVIYFISTIHHDRSKARNPICPSVLVLFYRILCIILLEFINFL